MAVNILNRLLSLSEPRFDWIQVEVTSRCNAACIYCPRTVYGHAWRDRDLSMESFMRLVPAFRRTRLVHLQGWGEPFLNPHFFKMLDTAKRAGCRVGTTTNGMLLDKGKIARLVDSGIDLVAFSLAGTGEENDRVRKGTRLEQVIETIRALSAEKKRRSVQKPAIHVAYMLLRSGLEAIGRLPSLVSGIGVNHVMITTLDFAASEDLVNEMLHPATPAEYESLQSLLDELSAKGEVQGAGIHHHLPRPGTGSSKCTENVHGAICISADGATMPCVFTNLDLPAASYFAGGEKRSYRRMSFGNAAERPVSEIWRDQSYKAFRASFRKGSLAPHCRNCPKLR